jgi:hypothetical protein
VVGPFQAITAGESMHGRVSHVRCPLESICIRSPGRIAVTDPNGPSGGFAADRRVLAEPNVCLPWDRRFTSR